MQLPLIDKVSRKPAPWLIGLTAAGLVSLSATTIFVMRGNAPKQDWRDLTVPVQLQDITLRIAANGTVVPVQTVNLSPKTAGRLMELLVEQGDRVQAGQIIARMENEELQAEYDQALAGLRQAEANLALLQAGTRPESIAQAAASVKQAQARVVEAQTRLNLARERVQRNQMLAVDGAISRDRLDEVLNEERNAQANLDQAKAGLDNTLQQLKQQQNGPRVQEIAQAKAQVAAAQGRLRAVQTQLDNTLIRAPFAGIITQKYATEGAFVTPTTSASSTSSATSTSIVALANGLEILAKVPEVDIGQIKLGQEVEIRADAYPDQVFKGKVRLIAPEAVVEQNVTSFQVRVSIVSGKEKLRSGMNVDLTFLGKRMNQALMVPTVAIVTNKGQTGVLVPGRNNQPRFQTVTIGPTIGNQTQVLEGLKDGEPVFVELPEGKNLEAIIKGMGQK
jgi:HlyD family secretion protein